MKSINRHKFSKKSRSRSRSKRSKFCQKQLSEKIKINMHEIGKLFTSRNQAIAVAYNQVHKMYPQCPA